MPRRALPVLLLLSLTAVVLSVSWPVPATAPGGPGLRVMTWNVKTGDFDPDDWVRVVADRHPDVVAFQEICVREAEQLADLLRDGYGVEYAVAVGGAREARYPGCAATAAGPVVFGQAILSRLPIRDATTTVLPDGGGLDEPRVLLSATVDAPGGPVRLLTTHITIGPDAAEDAGTSARRGALQAEQVDRVAREVTRSGSRVLVMGDFNLDPDDPRLDAMLRAGTLEVDRGRNSPTSHNRADDPGSAAARKLDHVFLKGLTPIGEPETSWVDGSDHRPLVATLRG